MVRLVGCGLVVLALIGQVTAAAGARTAYDPKVVVRYEGTFTSFAYTASSIDMNGKAKFLSPKTESWTWSYSWAGKLSVLHQRRPVKFTSEFITGIVKRVDQLPDQRSGNCLFSYVAKPGAYQFNAPVQVPYRAGKGYAWSEGSVTFIQFPPLETNNVIAHAQSDPKQNGHCRTFGPSPSMAARFPPSMGTVFKFVDLSRSTSRIRRFDRKVRRPNGQPEEVERLRSSVTLVVKAPR